MPFVNLLPKRKLLETIESYSEKLASTEIVDPVETVACHLAKLVLVKDREKKVRSIQTVAQLNPEAALTPALKEIVGISKKWPRRKETELTTLLATTLRGICSTGPS